MPRLKVLLTVTTYPLPSRSYDELVCTATKPGHAKRYKNTFVIIGVFYPLKEIQGKLF
jgi:hypothetical protein